MPVLVVPGCVTPLPAELTWGALGFAPLCANAAGAIIIAAAAAAINVFFILSSFVFMPRAE
jgi:hypothetical protein